MAAKHPYLLSKHKIKVSYLIAVYNKEEYICDCVSSILSEADSHLEIEICIVDDGSTDNSFNIINSKYSTNPLIKISRFGRNRGKNAAYNKAFSLSTGDYVCLFGADDIVVHSRTKKLVNSSKLLNKSIYGKEIRFYSKSQSIHEIEKFVRNNPKSTDRKTLDFIHNIIENSLSGGNGLIIREHAKDIFPIPEYLKFEDWWVSYHLLKAEQVHYISDFVTIYRIHGENDHASSVNKYETIKKDYLRHFDYLNEFEKLASSGAEMDAIYKARLMRKAFLGNIQFEEVNSLKSLPIDKYTFRTLFYYVFGAKLACDAKELIDNILPQSIVHIIKKSF